jgi:cell shape-determining protein MreD
MRTKTVLLVTVFCLALVLVQTSFFYVFFGINLNPNLLWALVFALYLANKSDYCYVTSITGGVIIDMLGASIIGYFSVLSVFFVLSAGYIKKYFFRSLITQFLLFYVMSLLFEFVYKSPQFVFKPYAFIQSLITTVFMIVFYLIIQKFSSQHFGINEEIIYRRNK